MNGDKEHPLAGLCIVLFVVFLAVLTALFHGLPGALPAFLSLVFAVLGGLGLALWKRVRKLEEQVTSLRDRLWKLENDKNSNL